jgi:hypothetical protein
MRGLSRSPRRFQRRRSAGGEPQVSLTACRQGSRMGVDPFDVYSDILPLDQASTLRCKFVELRAFLLTCEVLSFPMDIFPYYFCWQPCGQCLSGNVFCDTAPAAMIAPSPMVTPLRIIAFVPIQTWSPMTIGLL